MKKKLELVLSQDDAAPDSMVVFQDRFKELVGVSFLTFKRMIDEQGKRKYPEPNSITYETDKWHLHLSCDDPFWKLSKIIHENQEQ